MAKKQHHTYNVGDIVTFKFLTGDILTGKIINHTWKEDNTPSYKIKVEDSKGFTIYPCMTDARITKREKTARVADKEFNLKSSDILRKQMENKSKKIKKSDESDLDKAIEAQKNFLG